MKKITVVLVDDHTVVREGLRAMLANEPDIEVVGEASDGRRALTLVKQSPPDVVVMDVAMPLLNGMDATRQILRMSRSTGVLVLSSYTDEECVDQLIKAGAAGYLCKQTAANDLLKAIREVRRGNRYFSPSIARQIQEKHKTRPQDYGEKRELTEREAEVLELVATGYSNKESAEQLGISIKTIEKHRQQVMNKLNIHETAGLTRYAISKGLIERKTAETVTD